MSTPPSADALPAALVDRDQWVCWRTQKRDGKQTKVPIIPGSTQFASTTSPETWTTFSMARQAVTNTPVDGLGIVFTATDPLVGIDLDDCRDPDAETPTAWAAEILDTLDSYSEVSPSGTGYHVIVRGERPEGRNRAGDLEVYDRSRFFTVTGDHVAATPESVASREAALATLVEEELADDSTATSSPDSAATGTQLSPDESSTHDAAVPVPDDELLERAQNAANGDKFSRLWSGSTSGYESHSEADLALCRLLAFWTGGDPARVDRLFRRSGLYRDKWDVVHYADGSTYGEKTVERAVRATDDVYTPPEADDSSDAPTTTPTDRSSPATNAASADAPATDAADAPSVPGVDAAPPTDNLTELPPTHPQRAQARRERIEELADRIEDLLAENNRLRAELETERQRRQELETTQEDSASGWWPFANE